jgi:hypothetical protein
MSDHEGEDFALRGQMSASAEYYGEELKRVAEVFGDLATIQKHVVLTRCTSHWS